jgi:LysR family transcriptional regulator, glycine cleavage system transcriptional activator
LKRGEIPSIGGLTAFVAAAQHGSFTRAADELNLSQGAISRQIREIELHLGIRLFERIRQRVVLTDAGRLYLSQVKKALDDLAGATQRLTSFSNSTILNLVVLPTFAAHWLVPRLSDFQNRNPAIMVHVTTRQSPINYASEPFDAAVFHGASHWPGTISYHLMDADVIAVSSPKLGAKRAIKTAADVATFPLVHKTGKSSRWAEWMAEAGVTLDRPLHGHAYENFAMMAQAAVAGLGIALLPRYLIADEIASRRLEIVASEFADLKTSYYLILPETRSGSGAVKSFAEWVIAEAQAFKAAKSANGLRTHKKKTARQPNGRHKIAAENGAAAQPRPTD